MESLIGVLGLDRLINPKSLKITKKDVVSMVKFNKSIPKEIKEFLGLKKPLPYKTPKTQIQLDDFDAIIEDLSQDFTYDEMTTKLGQLAADELEPFLVTYMHVVDILQKAKPPTVTDGVLGIIDDEPSDSEKIEYLWLCRLVQDISWLFELMKTDTLTISDVESFQQLYPETYNTIMLEVVTQLSEKSTDKIKEVNRSWQLGPLASLAKQPKVGIAELQQLQQTYMTEEEPTQGEMGGKSPQGLTQSQKIEEL